MPAEFRTRHARGRRVRARCICTALMSAALAMMIPASAATAPATAGAWPALVDEFIESYFKAHPSMAAQQGRHEFDGILPDWSAAGIRSETARLKAFRVRAAAFPDGVLSPPQRLERDFLLTRIDREIFWNEIAQAPFRNPEFYLGMNDGGDSISPSSYIERPYAPAAVRMRAFIKYARHLVPALAQIRANLRMPMPASYIKVGVSGFAGLADFFRGDIPVAFADVQDAALQSELQQAIKPAAAALDELARWMQSQAPRAVDNDTLGREKFLLMLRMTERVDMTLEELLAAGRADLERNLAALRETCAHFAPGATPAACVARVESHKPAAGPVAEARDQVAMLHRFIIDKDIATIPGNEEIRVEEAPPYNRENSAYIGSPGPYEKNLPSVYYIAPPDPAWTAEERDAYISGKASLLFGTVHEVWPGHFLQQMWANRAASKLAGLFYSYAYSEGWAHYAEELVWEKGLGGDDETKIGLLYNALLRNVRYLSAIGLQTQGMSVAQSEKMFREEAFQDPGNARQQAARGTYDPGYLNYTLGKLMLRKLRNDYCASRGGEACWKQFHDKLLSYGAPPIPLVRKIMLPGDSGPLL